MKYIMDDPREAERLESKVNATDWLEQHYKKISGTGSSTLEVGCGPGTLLRAIKNHAPSQNVVGIDLSYDRLSHEPSRKSVHLVQADSPTLPFSGNSFDSVYTRFLLEYLPNCEQVVHEIFRVCKPGGKIMLQDLDAQLVTNWPIADDLVITIDTILIALAKTGFDPLVGRKLYAMARTAGLENIEVSVEAYHLIAGTIEPAQRIQWKLKIDIARPLIADALGGEKKAGLFIDRFLRYLDDPETFSYSNLITVVGTKPIRQ